MAEAIISDVLPAVEEENYRKTLRRNVEKYGLALGIRKTIDTPQNNFKRNIECEQTQEILEHYPLLLILTHNYRSEVLAAIGGLPRSDSRETFREVRLLAEVSSKKGWLSRYVLPLYNTSKEQPTKLIKKISRKINPPEEISMGKATSSNAVSLRTAGEIIGQGGAVVACPEGTREKYGRWQTGVCAVAKVAKRLLEKEGGSGYIVFCDVKGIGAKSYLKRKVSRWFTDLSPFKNVSVSYSKPIPFSEIDTELLPDEMASQIQGKYRQWLNTLSAG